MSIEDFLNTVGTHHDLIAPRIRLIAESEPHLVTTMEKVMGEDMFCFKEKGMFKYGFSLHENHISFHNMVMYCYPEIRDTYAKYFKKSRLKKSCIHFSKDAELTLDIFKAILQQSAKQIYPKNE